MKKVISYLLTAAVALSGTLCTSAVVNAAESASDAKVAFTISFDKETASRGDTVTATISMDKNAGLIVANLSVAFDEDVLSVPATSNVTDEKLLTGFTGLQPEVVPSSPIGLRWSEPLATKNFTVTGKLATIKFVVNDNADFGNYEDLVTISKFQIVRIDESDPLLTPSFYSNDEVYVDTTKTKLLLPCDDKSHKWGEWSADTATCTKGGEQTRECTVCGKTETKTTAALGHDMGEYVTTTPPTCEGKGVATSTCKRGCGYTETIELEAAGHKFSDPQVTKPATCTEPGEEEGTCSVCGKTTTNVIPPLGHNVSSWEETSATCTTPGTRTGECSVCGETITEETEPAKGHNVTEWETTKEASCTEDGERKGTCTVCGEEVTETIKAAGHTWGAWKDVPGTAGLQIRECTVCGETETQTVSSGSTGNSTIPSTPSGNTSPSTEASNTEETSQNSAPAESSDTSAPAETAAPAEAQSSESSETAAPSVSEEQTAASSDNAADSEDSNVPTANYPAMGAIAVLIAISGTAVALSIKKRK